MIKLELHARQCHFIHQTHLLAKAPMQDLLQNRPPWQNSEARPCVPQFSQRQMSSELNSMDCPRSTVASSPSSQLGLALPPADKIYRRDSILKLGQHCWSWHEKFTIASYCSKASCSVTRLKYMLESQGQHFYNFEKSYVGKIPRCLSITKNGKLTKQISWYSVSKLEEPSQKLSANLRVPTCPCFCVVWSQHPPSSPHFPPSPLYQIHSCGTAKRCRITDWAKRSQNAPGTAVFKDQEVNINKAMLHTPWENYQAVFLCHLSTP